MIDSGTLLQGRFLIEEKIGMGGMGAVYRAVDQKFGSVVAIKETFYGDTELGEAFEREARLLNGLHHPIIPHVSDYFTENGGHFLVMEYIEGEDLSEILKRGETFEISTVMGWTLDILDGLDYLHSQDPPIIHRDIKPNNLKLTSRGRIVLLDFGMAKETSHNTLGAKSVFGYSRRYSPLEQIEGTGTDVRSDIFSLGASVYHLLTGSPPADVLSRASAIVAGRPDPLLPVNAINTDVPESVAAILNSALALSQENRFESARAMSNALEYAIGTNPIAQKKENENLIAHSGGGINESTEEAAAYNAIAAIEASGAAGQNAFGRSAADLREDDSFQNSTSAAAGEDSSWTRALSANAIPSAQIRRRGRPGYVFWVPAAILGMALLLFGTYRATKTERSTTEVPAEAPATNLNADSNEPANEDSVTNQPENSLDVPAESQADGTAASDEPEVTDNGIDLRKGPIVTRRETTRGNATEPKRETRVAAPEPTRSSTSRNQTRRPATQQPQRAVRPAFEQPRVSSIEAIFTGVPYEKRRRWEDRYMSPEEELRRRRVRQIMRENRRRQLPF